MKNQSKGDCLVHSGVLIITVFNYRTDFPYPVFQDAVGGVYGAKKAYRCK